MLSERGVRLPMDCGDRGAVRRRGSVGKRLGRGEVLVGRDARGGWGQNSARGDVGYIGGCLLGRGGGVVGGRLPMHLRLRAPRGGVWG